MQMDLKLKGRTALVTGASAGIGTGIAQSLAAEGVDLALAGRNRAALDKLADQLIAAHGTRAVVTVGDLSERDVPKRIAEEARKALGRPIDILINNAGGSRPLRGEETEEFWEEAIAFNFSSVRRLTRQVLPDMKAAKWGRIVNLTGAMFGKSINGAGAAKAALVVWSRAIAFEVAPHGVTVNCVAPGRIDSVQIRENLHPTEESRQAYIRDNIPIGYFGEPSDIGDLVAFLSSPRAGYISGAHIPVDGGAVRMTM